MQVQDLLTLQELCIAMQLVSSLPVVQTYNSTSFDSLPTSLLEQIFADSEHTN